MMQHKIIRPFYDEPSARFTINELAKKTGISYSYVHGRVKNLKDRRILAVQERSRRNYCRPNYDNPNIKTIFVEISDQEAEAFLRKNDKISLIRDKLLAVLPRKTDFNLLSVVLFGSVSRGTDSRMSDIDLFILVSSKKLYDDIIDMECAALSRSFGVEINPVTAEPVNLINMLAAGDDNVAKEIMKCKVILFGAEKFWELVLEAIK